MYRLYNENEGLSDIHTEGKAGGHVYSMTPSLNCTRMQPMQFTLTKMAVQIDSNAKWPISTNLGPPRAAVLHKFTSLATKMKKRVNHSGADSSTH